MNLAALRERVRTLTGVWSVDVVKDALIDAMLNDALTALQRSQDWTIPVPAGFTQPTFTQMSTNTDTPGANWDQYHVMLSYRVASQVLAFEADDTNRGAFFAQEYDKMYAEMVEYFLPRAATGGVADTEAIVRYVRDLTGQYGIDLPTSLLRTWLDECYQELFSMYKWPTTGTLTWATATSLRSANPTFSEPTKYSSVLAYKVATRIMAAVPEMQARAVVYQGEYDRLLAAMLSDFFPAQSAVASTTLTDLVGNVRYLIGNYTKALPDAAIVSWLNDAYTELAQDKDWPWLEQTATTDFNVSAGSTTQALPNGTRRVLGVYFLGGNYDGVPDQWLAAPHLLDIEEYAPRTVYDIADDGILRWAPELSEAGVLRVQYVRNISPLSSGTDQPLFAVRFRPILAYRAAMRYASMNGEKDRVQTFQSEYQSMYEQMVNEYLLDHDTNPLQLGSEGLETRRYLPWFRTA